jgi:hypothetical protein
MDESSSYWFGYSMGLGWCLGMVIVLLGSFLFRYRICIGWYRYSSGVGIESWDWVGCLGVPLECLWSRQGVVLVLASLEWYGIVWYGDWIRMVLGIRIGLGI